MHLPLERLNLAKLRSTVVAVQLSPQAFTCATRLGRWRRVRGEVSWARTDPPHLIDVGLDAYRLPLSIFSVNCWVAQQKDRALALEDHRAEVISSAHIDWASDLERPDAELTLRNLRSP